MRSSMWGSKRAKKRNISQAKRRLILKSAESRQSEPDKPNWGSVFAAMGSIATAFSVLIISYQVYLQRLQYETSLQPHLALNVDFRRGQVTIRSEGLGPAVLDAFVVSSFGGNTTYFYLDRNAFVEPNKRDTFLRHLRELVRDALRDLKIDPVKIKFAPAFTVMAPGRSHKILEFGDRDSENPLPQNINAALFQRVDLGVCYRSVTDGTRGYISSISGRSKDNTDPAWHACHANS